MHQGLQKLAKTLSAFSRKDELVQYPNRESNLRSFKAWFGNSARCSMGNIFLAHGDYYLPTRLLGRGEGEVLIQK
jgi:hypothetical protein